MTEITFQELIDQVKKDLFASYQGTELEGLDACPMFFVEQLELELDVSFSLSGEGGLKVGVIPQILEVEGSGGRGKTTGHTMKITLKNLFTREELREMIPDLVLESCKQAARFGTVKGSQKRRPGDE